MASQSIAIVGMAGMFPGARNLREYWYNLANGVDAIQDVPAGRWPEEGLYPPDHDAYVACRRGGFLPQPISFDPCRHAIVPNQVKFGDPDQFIMLDVISQAMTDAAIATDDPVRRRTDLIIGRGGYLSNKMCETYVRVEVIERLKGFLRAHHSEISNSFLDELEAELRGTLPMADPDSLSTMIPNLVAGRAANRLNLRGASYTIDAACASSLVALDHAVTRLRQGTCDLAVAAGVHLVQTPSFWFVFSKLGALSQQGMIRPFDRRADGLLIGEGLGAVVLKRFEDACRDNDRVYGIIRGVGTSSDGREAGILAPSSLGQIAALERAYADGQVDPASIGLLEAHGTAMAAGDEAELETIREFFGASKIKACNRALGSVKSMLGHLMPAAGMAGFIKCVLSLQHKVLPPTLHCEEPLPRIAEIDFYLNTNTRPWIHPSPGEPRRAAVNAFGFGGINSHAIVEEYRESDFVPAFRPQERPITSAVKSPTELFAFSAPKKTGLIVRLEETLVCLEENEIKEGALASLAATLFDSLSLQPEHKQLWIVAGNGQELRARICESLECLRRDECPANDKEMVFYRDTVAPRGKVAFLFPGLAFPGIIGEYPDHLAQLCLHFPEVRAEFDKIDRKDDNPEDPIPFSSILLPPHSLPEEIRAKLRERLAPPRLSGEDEVYPVWPAAERNLSPAAAAISNWVGWVVVRPFKIPVEMMCGQSLGDIAALCAAGIGDFETDVLPRFWNGLSIPPVYTGLGRMALVGATAEDFQRYNSDLPETAIAIHVSREMQIVGGEKDQLATMVSRLKGAGVLATMLPFPPAHTPRLSTMRETVLELFDSNQEPRPANVRLYSAISHDVFPADKEGIRKLLLGNVDQPVHFWQTNERLYEDGARIFVQIGCGSIAANIQSQLNYPDIVCTSIDVDSRHPLTQLQVMLATLMQSGVDADLTPLFRHRDIERVDLAKPRYASQANSPTTVPLSLFYAPFEKKQSSPRSEFAHSSSCSHADRDDEYGGHVALLISNGDANDQCRMPFVGDVLEYEPGESVAVERSLDLNRDLYLQDHLFVEAPGCKPVSECLPVLPMTMTMEALAEVAALLAEGRGLIAIEQVRASRWIALLDEDNKKITIRARVITGAAHREQMRIAAEVYDDNQLCASAVLVFGNVYEETLLFDPTPTEEETAWPCAISSIYADNYLFHGPAFHCISDLFGCFADGFEAELTTLPTDRLFANAPNPELLTDPCVMDALGQVLGLWIESYGVHVLPIGVDKVEFYGPTPVPGSRCLVRGKVRSLDLEARLVVVDMELYDPKGNLWLRVSGWTDWIYRWPPALVDTLRRPTRNTIAAALNASPLGDHCTAVLATKKDIRHAHLEWLARLVLTNQEEQELLTHTDKKELFEQYLISRIAAKDAARVWLQRRDGGDYLHPASLQIAHDPLGRPILHGAKSSPPYLALAHTDQAAIALAASRPVGVDIELLDRDVREVLAQFASQEEMALVGELTQRHPEDNWGLRLWCAKEAAAKCAGTGFQGRPKKFTAKVIDVDGRCLLLDHGTNQEYEVYTLVVDAYLVAATVAHTP